MSRSLVNKATADDRKAVGGPVLRDLAERSKISIQESSAIEGYLLKRLVKKSPEVKLKVLNCIKYLCVNGRDEFRISFQRNNSLIRECTHYRGPPDPLRGDTPSEKVRNAAKETMTAIFNSGGRSNSLTTGKIQGFGSGPNSGFNNGGDQYTGTFKSYGNTNSRSNYNDRQTTPVHDYGSGTPKIESGAYSTGRMEGFGSGGAYNPKKDQSFMDRMKFKSQPSSSPYSGPPRGHNTYSGAGGMGGGHDPEPVTTGGRRRQKGKVGGSWLPDSPPTAIAQGVSNHTYDRNKISNQSQRPYQSSATFQSRNRPTPRERKTNSSDGAYEKTLVDQITHASGVYRSGAFKKETQDFIKKCLSLDIDVIAQYLDEKLSSSAYTTQLKAISIIFAIFDRKISDFDGAVDYFRDNPQNLLEVKDSGKTKTLRDKAEQILRSLGLNVENKPTQTELPPVQNTQPVQKDEGGSSSEPVIDFLNFGDSSANVPESNIAQDASSSGAFNFVESGQGAILTNEPDSIEQSDNLFGNLQIKNTEPTKTPDIGVVPQQSQESSDPMLSFFEHQDTKKTTSNDIVSGNIGGGNIGGGNIGGPRDLLGDLLASSGNSTTQNQGSVFPNSSQQQPNFYGQQQQPSYGQQPFFQTQQPSRQQQPFFGQTQQPIRQQPIRQQQTYGQQPLYGQPQPTRQQQSFYGQQQQFYVQQQQPVYGRPAQQTQSPGFGFIDPLDVSQPIQTTRPKKADPFAGVVDFTKS